jgi:putative membrane protein
MSFLIRLLVNAAALWVATRIIPGVTYSGDLLPFLAVALVFGIVNAFIGPVVKLLALPLIILTLGLFALVVNGLLLWLTSALSASRGLGFHVSGFWAALFGFAGSEHRKYGDLVFHRPRINALRSGNGAVVVASSPLPLCGGVTCAAF